MRQLLVMTASDLRQRVRDKSVIIFAIIVPLALMGVLNLVTGQGTSTELEPVTVAASVPDDQLSGALLDALGQAGTLEVTIEQAAADEVRERAETGDAQMGVIVPDGFAAAVQAGEAVEVTVIEGDGAGIEGDIVIAVLEGTLDRMYAGSVAATAGARLDLAPGELARIAQEVAAGEPTLTLAEGQASSEQLGRSASLVAGQAGLFLLFTVGFGVLGLLDEREQGTLARLRSMPMRPGLIVGAKALVSFILGVVATTVLLTTGGLLFDVDFGSPLPVGVLILCAVTATTSLMFIIARVARTAEQAGVAQSILAVVLGIAGGAFFPLTATGQVATLLDLNPVAALIRGLGITAGGGGVTDIGVPVATMLGAAAVFTVLSRLVPGREAS
ncbi:MAG: ABC transporter permease [Actinomycetota bacterium]|nr:ABC transporter permease [Actinomycetota bacterium]